MDFSSDANANFEGLLDGKSRNLHAADGGKDIARRAAELCGGALAMSDEERKAAPNFPCSHDPVEQYRLTPTFRHTRAISPKNAAPASGARYAVHAGQSTTG